MAFYPVGRILGVSKTRSNEQGVISFDETLVDDLVETFGNQDILKQRGGREATKDKLLRLLKSFPEPEKQQKILARIIRETRSRGCTIHHLKWWDIESSLRSLSATIQRDGYEIPAIFYWRKTDKSAPYTPPTTSPWVRDPSSSFGVRYECEAALYELVIHNYIEWLRAPLKIPTYLLRSA
jgi:hypothetical protein